jgi:hypothetical protein
VKIQKFEYVLAQIKMQGSAWKNNLLGEGRDPTLPTLSLPLLFLHLFYGLDFLLPTLDVKLKMFVTFNQEIQFMNRFLVKVASK